MWLKKVDVLLKGVDVRLKREGWFVVEGAFCVIEVS